MPDGRFLVEKYIITYVHSHTISAAAAKRKYNAGRKELMLIGGVTHPSKSLPGVLESVRHYELVKQRAVDAIMKGRDTIGLYGFFGIDDIGGPGGDIKEIELLDGAWKNHDILRDEDVTEGGILGASLAGAFSGYRILHVATRSVVVPEAPILSALVLSSEKGVSGGNGLLNIRKIASLKIAADLVTLSNAFLPPARYSKGEGIWSLCGSFMDAGARNVAISIWPVEGAVKTALIKRAYRLALEEKLPYCSAFARAKREFITQKADDSSPGGSPGNYSSPYFWGSFMLYGY
ncbi:MAG: CHAT domain-containing protein [Chrysiogenales bacterium]|nr:MAG: CHAT domain-containing protein [Chrysiogenales bacterium]